MQIVIDIPEYVKAELDGLYGINYLENNSCLIRNAIKNGVVLPKGHSDLISKNDVIDLINFGLLEDNINNIPVLVPADTKCTLLNSLSDPERYHELLDRYREE